MGEALLVLWMYGKGLIVILMRHELTELLRTTLGEDDGISWHHSHARGMKGDSEAGR